MEFNLAQVHEAVAAAVPGPGVHRVARPAAHLRGGRRPHPAPGQPPDRRGASASTPSGPTSAGHESGQDHLACYLHNGNEYLEAMLGSYKARVAPFNVNYRYVAEELRYLLNDAGARAIVFHSTFADRVAEVLPDLPRLEVLLQVDDGSGDAAAARGGLVRGRRSPPPAPTPPTWRWSPDDLYILYTGGTTGMPKGVLWRQADIFVGAMGGRSLGHRRRVGGARADRRDGAAAAASACSPRPRSCTAPATGSPSTRSPAATRSASRTTPSASTPTTCGAPSSARRSTSC